MTLLCVGALWSAGCENEAEGLVVSAQTDFVPLTEFDTVRLSIDADVRVERHLDGSESFARPLALHVFRDVAPGRRLVGVSLVRDGEEVLSRRVEIDFRGSQLVNVILARSCASVRCEASLTCVRGVCTSPSCVTGNEPSCPRPQCTSHEHCASATSCVEPRCIAGICLETDGDECDTGEVCVPGTGCIARITEHDAAVRDGGGSVPDAHTGSVPPDAAEPDAPEGCAFDTQCDDGIDCTADSCNVSRVCVHTPRADACPTSTCAPSDPLADPSTGCLPPCDATTCVAGPCETATCVAGRCERASQCGGEEVCCGGSVCAANCGAVPCAGQPAGTVCRAASGLCDVAEVCDGTSPGCPADGVRPNTYVCRTQRGVCDRAERCDGSGRECPTDVRASNGTSCRAVAGTCDVAETCSGTSDDCPTNAFLPSGTICRARRSICDFAETCSGTTAACPTDAFHGEGVYCDPTCSEMHCQGGECTGTTPCPGGGAACLCIFIGS